MSDKKERAVKRKSEYFYFSSDGSCEDFDSDDSLGDKHYVANESDLNSSSEDWEIVSKIIMWLVSFLTKNMWHIFCNFVSLYF